MIEKMSAQDQTAYLYVTGPEGILTDQENWPCSPVVIMGEWAEYCYHESVYDPESPPTHIHTDWGDGTETFDKFDGSIGGPVSHRYTEKGEFTITVQLVQEWWPLVGRLEFKGMCQQSIRTVEIK